MNTRFSTPKILHQTWKNSDIPHPLSEYRSKWLRVTPEYIQKFYTDEDLRNVIRKYFPQYLTFYDRMTHNIERVDFARYAILYQFGGVYADLDTIPIKCIDGWLSTGAIILGSEPREHAKVYGRDVLICNAFMISPPQHEWWLDLMDYIVTNYKPDISPVDTTGPLVMTQFYEATANLPNYHYLLADKSTSPQDLTNLVTENTVIITDPCRFFPVTNTQYSQKNQSGFEHVSEDCDIDRDSYVAHVWTNTWVPNTVVNNVWRWAPLVLGIIILVILVWLFMKNK